jgi:hypothetical protein
MVVSALLVAGGCASASQETAEVAPIRLRAPSGVQARCGLEMIREVQRANDLTWSEQLFFWWSARNEARRAVQNEEQWRQRCVERYRQQGFEVVSTPR